MTDPYETYAYNIWYTAALDSVHRYGYVNTNHVRETITGHVPPRRVGRFYSAAHAAGILAPLDWGDVSTDHAGRNAGKPCRRWELNQ